MNEELQKVFAISGWNADKISGVVAPYPEPLNTHLSEMVSAIVSGRSPVVLPRIDSEKCLHFYITGEDSQQIEEIFLSIKAYLGRSFTTYTQATVSLSEDIFEKSILDLYPSGFMRVTIYKACSSDKNKDNAYWVMSSLNHALEQYHQRPISKFSIKRPVGVILRHFFSAVQNQKGIDALRFLDELKNHQRLSPRNILSLEIQALIAGGHWQQVLNHSKLDELLKVTVPRRLQKVLLGSVGFNKNDSTNPTDYVVKELSQRLQGLYPLFASPPDLENDAASAEKWKLWAIGAVSLGRTVAVEQLPNYVSSDWVDDLKRWAGITASLPKETPPSIQNYIEAEISAQSAARLLIESIQANFKDSQIIHSRLMEYPPEVIEGISKGNSSFREIWKNLQDMHGEQSEIDNWHHLFQSLGSNCSEEQARNCLILTIERSEYWSGDSWQEDGVMDDIGNISDDIAQGALRDLLPILLKWLADREKMLPSKVIEHLMILLVSDDQIAAEDLMLSAELLIMLLNQGHSQGQYCVLLECIDQCWEKTRSPRAVDSMLEIYETLIDFSCADEGKRVQSWIGIQSNLVLFWARLDDQQQQLCYEITQFVCGDISSLPTIKELNSDEVRENRADLNGKLLGIYTLTEGAGRRAQKMLMSYFPGLEIRLNHDKTATDALSTLVDSADYFVFSSRSAAHQAFYPISKKRKDLIYPQGKGTSSIVREFLNHVA
jgi:hypothetical protein